MQIKVTWEMRGSRIPEGSFTADTVASARAGVTVVVTQVLRQTPEDARETILDALEMAMMKQMRVSLDESGSWMYSADGLTVTATRY